MRFFADHFATVAGDLAFVQVEGAVLYLHAASVCAAGVGDLAVCDALQALAVGEGKHRAVVHGDGVKIAIRRDVEAVETEHRAVGRRPGGVQLYILLQEIIACRRDLIQRVDPCPIRYDLLYRVVADTGTVPGAADAVRPAVTGAGVLLDKHQLAVFLAELNLDTFLIAGESVHIRFLREDGKDNRVDPIRRFLRGHTDACAIGQTALADGDGPFRFDQIHVVLLAARRVAGDVGRAGHGEIAVHKHAAAVFGRPVAADLAAVHVERTVLPSFGPAVHIHAAAVFRPVAGDGAAVHIKGIHTPVFIVVDMHAASARSGSLVLGDNAAVHIKCTVGHPHAAVGLFLCVGDPSSPLTVGQGECGVIDDVDGIIAVSHRDAVAVETEHRAGDRRPGSGQRHVFGQVVTARSAGQLRHVRPRDKFGLRISLVIADELVRLAAETVRVPRGCALFQHHRAVIKVGLIRIGRVAHKALLVAAPRVCGDRDRLLSRFARRGHADARALAQTAIADGDGITPADQIHVVGAAVLRVLQDGHAAGHGKHAVGIHIHAAALLVGRIDADLAAAHVEFSVHIHAAAGGRVAAADLAAVHGERA